MCSILIPSPVKVFLLFPKNFLDRASLKNYGKNMKNFPISKKNENLKKYNLRTPQAVVSHQSTQSTRRSAKTWELGQQQAMVHPRNCSSSNIRFIGLFYSCLAGKLGRDLVAAAGCCCTLDRTHIQPRPGHRFNLMPLLRGPILVVPFSANSIEI